MKKMTKTFFAFFAMIVCAAALGFGCTPDPPESKGVKTDDGKAPPGASATGKSADGSSGATKTKPD